MTITGASNQSVQDNWYYFYNIEIEAKCIDSIPSTWDCNLDQYCNENVFGNGQFLTLLECQQNCISTVNTQRNDIKNTKLIGIYDVLGKKSIYSNHSIKFLFYDDGTVKKRIMLK